MERIHETVDFLGIPEISPGMAADLIGTRELERGNTCGIDIFDAAVGTQQDDAILPCFENGTVQPLALQERLVGRAFQACHLGTAMPNGDTNKQCPCDANSAEPAFIADQESMKCDPFNLELLL